MEINSEPVVDRPATDSRVRERQSLLVAVNCLLIGILGNFLFYDQWLGVNIGIYTTILVVVGIGLLIAMEVPLYLKHLAFGLPAILATFFLAVHSAEIVVLMNLAIAGGSMLVFIRFGRIERFLGGGMVYSILAQIETIMVGWIEGPMTLLSNSGKFLNQLHLEGHELGQTKAVLRGVALALPILIVFGLLLGSADVVFGDLLEDVFGWLNPDVDLVLQLIVIFMFTWVNLAVLRLLIFGPPFLEANIHEPTFNVGRLGMIETGILLGSVNLLFLVFVILQARYLFGGDSNINVQGYTYAEYARRGFYEMLTVSILTTGLIGILEWTTFRQPKQENLFRFLSITLMVLTAVILIAAWRRLALYEDAYGFTRLRVTSGIFMAWLGVLLGFLLMDVLLHRKLALVLIGGILCTFGYVGTLNFMNVDRFIASHNVERYYETGKIDIPYLMSLSDDAIPAIAPLIDDPNLEDLDRTTLMSGLANRLTDLDNDHVKRKGVDYHWGKAKAWEALDRHRDDLSEYMGRWQDPTFE